MKGILCVLSILVALVATGCVSSVRAGVHTGEDGLCQGIEMEGIQVRHPDFLRAERDADTDFILTLDPEHESLAEAREGIEARRQHQFNDFELPNRIAIRLFHFIGETDVREILDVFTQERDGDEWPAGSEFGLVREYSLNGRQMYGYSQSYHHQACGGTIMRGRVVVVPIENVDGLYAIITGEWENIWHPLMSRAFDIVSSTVSVRSAEIVRRPCP